MKNGCSVGCNNGGFTATRDRVRHRTRRNSEHRKDGSNDGCHHFENSNYSLFTHSKDFKKVNHLNQTEHPCIELHQGAK